MRWLKSHGMESMGYPRCQLWWQQKNMKMQRRRKGKRTRKRKLQVSQHYKGGLVGATCKNTEGITEVYDLNRKRCPTRSGPTWQMRNLRVQCSLPKRFGRSTSWQRRNTRRQDMLPQGQFSAIDKGTCVGRGGSEQQFRMFGRSSGGYGESATNGRCGEAFGGTHHVATVELCS